MVYTMALCRYFTLEHACTISECVSSTVSLLPRFRSRKATPDHPKKSHRLASIPCEKWQPNWEDAKTDDYYYGNSSTTYYSYTSSYYSYQSPDDDNNGHSSNSGDDEGLMSIPGKNR